MGIRARRIGVRFKPRGLTMKILPIMTPPEMQVFEDECFRAWLNRIDARIDYDTRRALGAVSTWRNAFDLGQSEGEAIADLKCAAENRAFCSGL